MKTPRQHSESGSPFLPIVKLLLIILILLILPDLVISRRRKGAKRKRKVNRAYSILRTECVEGPCQLIPWTENEMCITKCMRPECHETVYSGDRELELGEVDERKEVLFEECVKNYLREEERAQRASRKK